MDSIDHYGFVPINALDELQSNKSTSRVIAQERLSELFLEIKEQYIEALQLQQDLLWTDSIICLSSLLKSSKLSKLDSKGYKQVCNKIRFFSLKNLALAYRETEQYKLALDQALEAIWLVESLQKSIKDDDQIALVLGGYTKELLHFLFTCSFKIGSDVLELSIELIRLLLQMDPFITTATLNQMSSVCMIYGEFDLLEIISKRLNSSYSYPDTLSKLATIPLYNTLIKPSITLTRYTFDQQGFSSWEYILAKLVEMINSESPNERSSLSSILVNIDYNESTNTKVITNSQEQDGDEQDQDSIGTRVSRRRKHSASASKKQSWINYLAEIHHSIKPLSDIDIEKYKGLMEHLSNVFSYMSDNKIFIYQHPQTKEDSNMQEWIEKHHQHTYSFIDTIWIILLHHSNTEKSLYCSNRNHILKLLEFIFSCSSNSGFIESKPIDQVIQITLYGLQIVLYDTLITRHHDQFSNKVIYPPLFDILSSYLNIIPIDNHIENIKTIYCILAVVECSFENALSTNIRQDWIHDQQIYQEIYKAFKEKRYDIVLKLGIPIFKQNGMLDPFILIESSWDNPDLCASFMLKLLDIFISNPFESVTWNDSLSWIDILDKLFIMIYNSNIDKFIINRLLSNFDLCVPLLIVSWILLEKREEFNNNPSFTVIIWYYYISHVYQDHNIPSDIVDLICIILRQSHQINLDIRHKLAMFSISKYIDSDRYIKAWEICKSLNPPNGHNDDIKIFLDYLSYKDDKDESIDEHDLNILDKFISIVDSSSFSKYHRGLLTEFLTSGMIHALGYILPENHKIKNHLKKEFKWIYNASIFKSVNDIEYSKLFYFKAKYLECQSRESLLDRIGLLENCISISPNDFKAWSLLYDVYNDWIDDVLSQCSNTKPSESISKMLICRAVSLFRIGLMLVWLNDQDATCWYALGESYWRIVSQPFIGYVYSISSDATKEWINIANSSECKRIHYKLAWICYQSARFKSDDKSFYKNCTYMMGKCIEKFDDKVSLLMATKYYYESCQIELEMDNYYRFIVSLYKSFKKGYTTAEKVTKLLNKIKITDSCDIWNLFIHNFEKIIEMDKKGLEHRSIYRISRILYEDLHERSGWSRLSTLFCLKPTGKQLFMIWKTSYER